MHVHIQQLKLKHLPKSSTATQDKELTYLHDDVVVPCSGNVAPCEVIPVAGTDMQYLSQVGSD